jgi:hypothetical protein
MTDQQGWGPPQQQPPWEQQPYAGQQWQQQPPGAPPPPWQGQAYGGAQWQPGQQPYAGQPPQPGGPQYPAPNAGGRRGGPGRPPKKRHTARNMLLGAVGAIFLIIVIAAVASSQNNSVSKDSTPPAAKTATKHSSSQEPADNSTTGPIGTTFTVTETNQNGATVKYSITLDKVIQHAAPDNSFDAPPAGDHLSAAEFTISGLVGNDQDDANNDATAIGTDQQTYQTGAEGLAAGTNFNEGQFNTSPGSVSIGWVSFEVKDGVHVASIQWSPGSSMDGDTVTWTLST